MAALAVFLLMLLLLLLALWASLQQEQLGPAPPMHGTAAAAAATATGDSCSPHCEAVLLQGGWASRLQATVCMRLLVLYSRCMRACVYAHVTVRVSAPLDHSPGTMLQASAGRAIGAGRAAGTGGPPSWTTCPKSRCGGSAPQHGERGVAHS